MNFSLLKQQVNWSELLQAILSFTPVFAGFLLFHESLLFNIGLVTISLFIPIARIKSGISAAILQFVFIWFCFTLLFFALNKPYLFVVLCALMAFGSIYITRYGSNLRTIANFIFIPAVYLACELGENFHGISQMSVYIKFISLMPVSLFTIIILVFTREFFIHDKKSKKFPLRVHWKSFRGVEKLLWLKEAIAIFSGVTIAASFVVYMNISHGEWVIWSTAAVITGDLVSAQKKTKDRLLGLMIGIPWGFFVAQFLPKTTVVYSLAVLAIMLTLIAFKKYSVAFGSRCFFIVVASYIATSTPQIALERVENVVMGGIIGMAALYICHRLTRRFSLLDSEI